jgi:cobalt-zinc-cadmium efflux system outer membrane protein
MGDFYMCLNLSGLFFRKGADKLRLASRVTGIFLLIGLFPAQAGSFQKMISEHDAVRRGLERPEIIQQMKSRADLAESDVMEARTWENPEFSYDQETRNDDLGNIMERNYMLSQKVSISGQRAIRTEAAQQRRDAAFLETENWRLEKTAEIRKKFYQVLYQQRLMEIYAQISSAMDSLANVMQERKKAGDISRYDLNRLKQEQSLLMAEQRQALAEEKRLAQELFAVIGSDGEQPTQWAGVTGSLFPGASAGNLEDLLEQAENHPGLTAMKLRTKAFGTDERHAKRSWLPDIDLHMGYKDADEADADAILLGVSLPIPVFDRKAGAQQRASASRRHLQTEFALTLAEKKGSIRGLWRQDQELAAAIQALAEADSAALLETAQIAYKAGEIGILEILDAHRSAFEHQVKLLDLMKSARMVRIDLELNTGGIIQ